MPVNLSKIAVNTASVVVPVGDESMTVVYYPARVTEKMFSVLRAMDDMTPENIEQSFADFNQMIAALIKSWDVYEDAEETIPFPVDAARFSELPLGFRMAVFNAIMGDIRPEVLAAQNGRAPH